MTAREVLVYIDHLPSWSAFAEATAQDDEVAAMYAERESDGKPSGPRIMEWTPERSELVKVNDALATLTSIVLQAAGGKGAPPEPQPRPETAIDRLASRVQDASYEYLMERLAEAREGSSGG